MPDTDFYDDDGPNFTLWFYVENDKYHIHIYDAAEEEKIVIESEEFGDALHHALNEVDPVLAAAFFPEHFTWSEKHNNVKDD
jgi:hypothetical protein